MFFNPFIYFQVSLSLFNNKNHVDLSDYWKSGTWDIIEVPAYLNVHPNSKNYSRKYFYDFGDYKMKVAGFVVFSHWIFIC